MAETKANIFFFYGADTYRSFHKLQGWKTAFLTKYGQGSVRESAQQDEPIRLSEVVGGASLFNPTTLTIVRSPWPSGTEKGTVDLDDFFAFLEKGVSSSSFVLFWQKGGLDKRLNVTKKLLELGKGGKIQLQEFEELGESNALQFAAAEFKNRNLKIKRDAGELLVAFCVNEQGSVDSWALANAIKQLASFCDGVEFVTAEDVRSVVPPRAQTDVFLPALQTFAKKNIKGFLENLDTLARNAGSEQELLGLLSALFEQVKNMTVVKEMHSGGRNYDEIDQLLGFKKGRSKYVNMDARNFSDQELESLLEKIMTVEYNVKNGLAPLPAALAAAAGSVRE